MKGFPLRPVEMLERAELFSFLGRSIFSARFLGRGGIIVMAKSAEEVLVDRSKRGDVAAFEELISQYEKKVYNLAYRLTGNYDDASDVAQEAFLRAFGRIREFRGDSSFATWLFRIVSNACLDELRKRRRQRVTSLDEPVSTEEGDMQRQVADSGDGPEQSLERQEIRRAVQESINSLDEEFRMVVILRDIQGHSYEEIAMILDLSLGTVKSRLNRARHALKEKLISMELFAPKTVYSGRKGVNR